MAYVEKVTVRVELLQNLGEYSSVKPCYELVAQLEHGDDETFVIEELEQRLFERIWGVVDRELQERGEPAIYNKPDYFICRMSIPPVGNKSFNGFDEAIVFGYASDYEKFLEWTKEFESVAGYSLRVSTEPSYWLDPYGQKQFNKVLSRQRGYNKNVLSIGLINPPDIRFKPLEELLEKHRPTPAESTPEQPADVDNGYEEMEAIQQHSGLDADDEFEHPDDPDHDPLRHLHDQPLDETIF